MLSDFLKSLERGIESGIGKVRSYGRSFMAGIQQTFTQLIQPPRTVEEVVSRSSLARKSPSAPPPPRSPPSSLPPPSPSPFSSLPPIISGALRKRRAISLSPVPSVVATVGRRVSGAVSGWWKWRAERIEEQRRRFEQFRQNLLKAKSPAKLGLRTAEHALESIERGYERRVVQPVLARIAPEKFITVEKVREWKERIPEKPRVWTVVQRTPSGVVTTTYTQKSWKEITHRETLKETKPAPLPIGEQIKRGVVGGVLRFPLALTTAPILRLGVKGIRSPSELRKELGEMWKYAKQRPYEVGAEVATTFFMGGRVGRALGGKPIEVGRFERIVGKLTGRYVRRERIVPEGLKFSTLRMPKRTPAEVMKRIMEETKYKLSGKAEEVWHAKSYRRFKPSFFRGISEVPPGYSPVKGTYVAPAAYPAFAVPRSILLTKARVPPELRFEFEPTYFSIMTKGIRIPKRVRVTPKELVEARKAIGEFRLMEAPYSPKLALKRFAEYKKYVEEVAPKGYAYVSPEVTAKVPWHGELEVEAVIPVGTKVREYLLSRLFPKFTEEEVLIAKPTFRGEIALRRFYRQVEKALRQAKTEAEKRRIVETALSAEQALIKELLKKGWIKEKWGRLRINIRRLKVLEGAERSRANFHHAVREGFGRFGEATERLLRRGREIEVVPVREGRVWRRGIYVASPLLGTFSLSTSAFRASRFRGGRGFGARRGGLFIDWEGLEGFEGYEERVGSSPSRSIFPPLTQTRREIGRDVVRRELERFSDVVRREFSQVSTRVQGRRSEVMESRRSISSFLSQAERERENVVRKEIERFREGVRRISEIGESNIARISRGTEGVSFTFIIRPPKQVKWRVRKKHEKDFRKLLEEGVAGKFLKITPIASPSELLKGVWRR